MSSHTFRKATGRRDGYFAAAAAASMAAILIMLAVWGTYLSDWDAASARARESEETYRALRAVLAPAAWSDCATTSPDRDASCDAFAASYGDPNKPNAPSPHAVYALESIRDYYSTAPALDPNNCDIGSKHNVFAQRTATVIASGGANAATITRAGTQQRQILPYRNAWTAHKAPAVAPGQFAPPLEVVVYDPTGTDAVTGRITYAVSPTAIWEFAPDRDGPDACYVIVVPLATFEVKPGEYADLGRRIVYLRQPQPPCDLVLALRGANQPC